MLQNITYVLIRNPSPSFPQQLEIYLLLCHIAYYFEKNLTLYYIFYNTLVEEPLHVARWSLGKDKGTPICWQVALTIWKGWCAKPFYCCKQKARLLHLMVDWFELNFHRQLIMHCNLLPFIKLKACFFF